MRGNGLWQEESGGDGARLAQDIEPEADSNATAVARYEWGRAAPAEEVSMIRRLAAWIRKGYPTAAPECGHCYLIALRGLDGTAR